MAVSLALSLAVHAGMAGSVMAVFAARSLVARVAPWLAEPPAPPEQIAELTLPEQTPPDPVIWVRPGIDDSDSDSPAWIGYTDSTDHAAFPASVDQSAMTQDTPGMRGEEHAVALPPPAPPADPLPPAPETIAAQPTPEEATAHSLPNAPQPSPAVDSPTTDASAAPPAPLVIAPAPDAPAPNDAEHEAVQQAEDPEEDAEARDEPAAAPVNVAKEPNEPPPAPTPPPVVPKRADQTTPDTDTATPPAPTPPAPTPPAPTPPAPKPAGAPGEQSDKEADATSIKNAVDYRYGRVKAGAGIDIKTVRPDFSNFTLLTALPRPPIVEISFSTEGKVKNVRLLQSSGYKDVDEPIINAVWAWRAKGKKLEALAKQNPGAVLKISVRMLL